MQITPGDLDICARTVYGEARGESYQAKKAVAHVMVNRWRTTAGQFAADDTLATACLRHSQFSAWTANDPNFEVMHAATIESRLFRECVRAVLEALDEKDFTQNSKWYHTHSVSPRWSRDKEPVVSVGNHRFFNNID